MSTWYRILYFLHIATILVAFAPVLVAVLPDGADSVRATLDSVGRMVYAPALILTGLFGILLIVEHEGIGFDELWISLAFLVWFAMNGVFHAMVLAGGRKGDASRVMNGHAVMTVLLVVMLYLMVWTPGS
jgi:hypothetical protein